MQLQELKKLENPVVASLLKAQAGKVGSKKKQADFPDPLFVNKARYDANNFDRN